MKRLVATVLRPARAGLRVRALGLCLVALSAVVPRSAAAESAGEGEAGTGNGGAWYEQEAVNPGLESPPDRVDRSNPRAALRGFLAVMENGAGELGAHFLNLARTAPDRQAQAGPEIARKLFSIIQRQVWIDWSDLSSRSDALIEEAGSSDPRAGTPRRNLRIASLRTPESTYDLRLARYKAPGADPVWLFTPQTVSNVGPLYRVFGPRPYEAYIPAGLQREVLGLWLWEWIALPVFGLIVIGLGWFARRATCRLSERVGPGWLGTGLERSSLPVAILVSAAATRVILTWVLSFSGPVNAILGPALTVLMVLGSGLALLRVLDAVLNRITLRFIGEIDDKRGKDERELFTSIYALRRLIVLLMVVLASVIVLSRLNLFDSVGMTLIASAGVLTVIFGIAGQAVLGNILASLQIAFAKPVRIGDRVLFEGDWAYVEAIFYTYLRLRTWDRRRIVVPVTYFVSRPFENWSVTEARMMKVIEMRLDHAADIGVLRAEFERLVRDDPAAIEDENLLTYVSGHGAEGVEVTFLCMMPDPTTGWEAQVRLHEALVGFVRDEHPEWWPRERVQGAKGAAPDEADGPAGRAAVAAG